MRCPDLEQLADFQMEAVDAARRRHIAGHVAECETCRRELAALEKAAGAVALLPEPVMPDNLWPGIAARIAPRRHRVAVWWRALAGAGMLALLFFGSMAVNRPSQPLPMASTEESAFVARHELLAAQDPLADRASLAVRMIAYEGQQ